MFLVCHAQISFDAILLYHLPQAGMVHPAAYSTDVAYSHVLHS